MASRFLFRFGYESPDEYRTNQECGTDFESSMGVWIEAPTEELAVAWGKNVAEAFTSWLFKREGKDAYSWANGRYAW